MQLIIELTDEQEKALLTEYVSIEAYAQRVLEDRANRIAEQITRDYANNLVGVTAEEQAIIDAAVGKKILLKAESIPDDVKQIIVKRAATLTMVEKIAEQAEELNPVVMK